MLRNSSGSARRVGVVILLRLQELNRGRRALMLAIRVPIIFLTIAFFFALVSSPLSGSVSNPNWQFIGPQPIAGVQANYGGIKLDGSFHATGRVTSIAVDPTGLDTCGPSMNSACRMFVGTAGGGLWMSLNGGTTFTNISGILDPGGILNGTFPQTTVGSVALNTNTTPPTIYLATGEGNFSDSFWGDGIFVSSNLGDSWSKIATSIKDYTGFV